MTSFFTLKYIVVLLKIRERYGIKHIINGDIQCKDIMLVDSENGGTISMDLDKALDMAQEQEIDLVQLSEKDGTAICKLMDYSKFVYDQKKREKKNSSKPKQELKEIRLGDSIADNDAKVKAKNVVRLLNEGDKVKISITYKGRLIAFIKRGIDKLNDFKTIIDVDYTIDKQPTIEGNRVYMILSPKK